MKLTTRRTTNRSYGLPTGTESVYRQISLMVIRRMGWATGTVKATLGKPEDAGFWRVQITVPDPSGDAFTAVQCFTVINGFPASGGTAADNLGVTHVGGNYRFAGPGSLLGNGAVSSLVEGAQQILNLGARRAFCYLTFQYKDSDYNGDDFGPGPINNLTDLAKTPPFQQLFEQPLDTIVLTVYGFGNKLGSWTGHKAAKTSISTRPPRRRKSPIWWLTWPKPIQGRNSSSRIGKAIGNYWKGTIRMAPWPSPASMNSSVGCRLVKTA